MSDKKHTPGPWEVRADPSHYDSFTTVVAGSGEQRKGMLRELIVEIGGWAGIETAEANARLIAAAPDLLAACQRLVTLIDESDQWSDVVSGTAMGEIVNEARTAVAKAEGK